MSARTAAVLLLTLAPLPAAAFPGSVRWGYANCRSCHYNVAGGGVLTSYGRQMSRELLSTWGSESEAEFGYGRVATPSWLALGGDLVVMGTSRRPSRTDSFQLLTADLEAAAAWGKLTAVVAAGPEPLTGRMDAAGWTSRRHFVQYDLSRTFSARAGRFLPHYGIWNGDLSVATRTGLGWDANATSYNLELHHVGERLSGSVTLVRGPHDVLHSPRESGLVSTASLFFAGKRKVGVSALALDGGGLARRAAGVHGVFGIGSHAYLLTETSVHRRRGGGRSGDWEVLSNSCFARETVKGLYVLLLDEISHRKIGGRSRTSHSYGAALRWFPRPHMETQLRWRRQDVDAVSPRELDGLSLFARFYL